LPLQVSMNQDTMWIFAPNRFVNDWVQLHYKKKLLISC
jgi:chromosomal replication initiation ATPase DnaA